MDNHNYIHRAIYLLTFAIIVLCIVIVNRDWSKDDRIATLEWKNEELIGIVRDMNILLENNRQVTSAQGVSLFIQTGILECLLKGFEPEMPKGDGKLNL